MFESISRRRFLGQAVGSVCVAQGTAALGNAALPPDAAAATGAVTSMGLVLYCRSIKRKKLSDTTPSLDLYHPDHFLDECLRLGVQGMQVDLGRLSDAEAEALQARAAQTGQYLEGIITLPKDDADLERFAQHARSTRRAGAKIARTTIIPGRRYEQFKSLAEFREAEKRGEQLVRRAIPVLEREQLTIAIENHKDQRNDERLQLFERLGHKLVGACVDTGNSLALLEDPVETVAAFAPWARAVHLKDQAVQRVPTGYSLADVPLGQGCLDLEKMVSLLQAAQPGIRFSLELITRDPLKIPCLTGDYFNVFAILPARDLARMIELVELRSADSLPMVSTLSAEKQLELEDHHLSESIRFAAENLKLSAAKRPR